MDEVTSGEDRMIDLVGCPADTCSFEGSISEVADHVTESDDEDHAWEAFGHENADKFCWALILRKDGDYRTRRKRRRPSVNVPERSNDYSSS
ncbi:hypothetical protein HTG_17560 [Natrinema mahii]|nr:hypothetical protein HTG_17560 [Natrinema mahii]